MLACTKIVYISNFSAVADLITKVPVSTWAKISTQLQLVYSTLVGRVHQLNLKLKNLSKLNTFDFSLVSTFGGSEFISQIYLLFSNPHLQRSRVKWGG